LDDYQSVRLYEVSIATVLVSGGERKRLKKPTKSCFRATCAVSKFRVKTKQT
jgi:hypothetical protein